MESLKLLLLIVLPAIVIACIVGVASGKHQVKKASGQLRPLLGRKERIIYSASMALGAALLLIGFFYTPAPDDGMEGMEDMGQYGDMGDMGMHEDGMAALPEDDILDMPEGEIITDELDPAIESEPADEAVTDDGEIDEPEAETEDAAESGEAETEGLPAEEEINTEAVAIPAPLPAPRAATREAAPASRAAG